MVRRTRRLWTDEEKRSICLPTTAPGVSAAQVGLRYSVNAKAAAVAYPLIETSQLNAFDPHAGSPTHSPASRNTRSQRSMACCRGAGLGSGQAGCLLRCHNVSGIPRGLPCFVDLLLTRAGGMQIPHKISLAGRCYCYVFWLREQDLNL